ncbi:MAG: FAD-dependent oxidoreductase, partial [Balneolales bacterium]
MTQSPNYDFVILGAGLAGLALADALGARGHRVLIIEKDVPGAGASGTPVGLVNPAAGRKANLSWEAERCYAAVEQNLQKVQDGGGKPFFFRSGLLRPALDDASLTNFRKAYERGDWPAGWCRWMDPGEVSRANPFLIETGGGLCITVGLTVCVPAFLRAWSAYLAERGIPCLTRQDYTLIREGNHWKIRTGKQGSVQAGSVIFAGGHTVIRSPYWRDIPIHPVKGQISEYTAETDLSGWKMPIAASGYFARAGSNRFVAGGTYEHEFTDERSDARGQGTLEKKVGAVMPSLLSQSALTGQWAGVRASTPNRLPILGPHASEPNLHLFSGLGSKGLLYAAFTAGLLA